MFATTVCLELDTRLELATQPWQGRMLPLHQSNINEGFDGR